MFAAISPKNDTVSPQNPRDFTGGWLIHACLLIILIILYLCSLIDLSDMNAWYHMENEREFRGQASALAVFPDEVDEPMDGLIEVLPGAQAGIPNVRPGRDGAIQPGGWVMESASYE
jgi:hypothetical protein